MNNVVKGGAKLWVISWVMLSAVFSSSAYADSGNFHLNPAIGYLKFDGDSGLKNSLMSVLGMEYRASDVYGVSATWAQGKADERGGNNDGEVVLFYIDGLYYFPRDKNWQPYLAIGLGNRIVDSDASTERDSQLLIGGGLRVALGADISLRSEVRMIQNLTNDETDALLTLGFSWGFGD